MRVFFGIHLGDSRGSMNRSKKRGQEFRDMLLAIGDDGNGRFGRAIGGHIVIH